MLIVVQLEELMAAWRSLGRSRKSSQKELTSKSSLFRHIYKDPLQRSVLILKLEDLGILEGRLPNYEATS